MGMDPPIESDVTVHATRPIGAPSSGGWTITMTRQRWNAGRCAPPPAVVSRKEASEEQRRAAVSSTAKYLVVLDRYWRSDRIGSEGRALLDEHRALEHRGQTIRCQHRNPIKIHIRWKDWPHCCARSVCQRRESFLVKEFHRWVKLLLSLLFSVFSWPC